MNRLMALCAGFDIKGLASDLAKGEKSGRGGNAGGYAVGFAAL